MDWGSNADPEAINQLQGVVDEVVVQTYQGRRTIPSYRAYLPRIARLTLPFKIGLVQDGGVGSAGQPGRQPLVPRLCGIPAEAAEAARDRRYPSRSSVISTRSMPGAKPSGTCRVWTKPWRAKKPRLCCVVSIADRPERRIGGDAVEPFGQQHRAQPGAVPVGAHHAPAQHRHRCVALGRRVAAAAHRLARRILAARSTGRAGPRRNRGNPAAPAPRRSAARCCRTGPGPGPGPPAARGGCEHCHRSWAILQPANLAYEPAKGGLHDTDTHDPPHRLRPGPAGRPDGAGAGL